MSPPRPPPTPGPPPNPDAPSIISIGSGWLPEHMGGLERVYYHLHGSLKTHGAHVRGVVVGSSDVAKSTGGRVVGAAAPDAPLAARLVGVRRAVQAAVAESAPDVVASHFALYAAPVLDLLGRTPHVVHFHGPWAAEGRAERSPGEALKRAVERAVYARGGRFIVLSEAFRRLLTSRYGVPDGRVRLVPGGVDAERFAVETSRTEARERLGWAADRPTVLAVRRLAHRMGLEVLLDAVVEVRRTVPDVLVLIAGTGALADALAAQIGVLGLRDHVRLLGFVPDDDLPLAYRAADVSVVPTQALEGFGLITLESLATGTPVLVTPVGGLPEVVRPLAPSLVTEDASAGAIARGLDRALRQPGTLPDADACAAYARSRFGWGAVAQRVLAVYEEAAHEGATR